MFSVIQNAACNKHPTPWNRYPFYSEAVETDVAFMKQVDAVCRELGESGKPKAPSACHMAEGVPPSARAAHARSPASVPDSAPAPAPTPALAPAAALTSAADRNFTPSMERQYSQSPAVVQRSADDASILGILLEQQRLMHERSEAKADKLLEEAKADNQEMQQQLKDIEAKLMLQEVVTMSQVAALEQRLEALHTTKLLSDEELYALEDVVADFFEAKAACGIVTMQVANANHAVGTLHKLVVLSEGVSKDGTLARQLRRKFAKVT
eukprot:COSAG02_NODE_7167_length_3141_cov_3.358317_2_plen_267_part_00